MRSEVVTAIITTALAPVSTSKIVKPYLPKETVTSGLDKGHTSHAGSTGQDSPIVAPAGDKGKLVSTGFRCERSLLTVGLLIVLCIIGAPVFFFVGFFFFLQVFWR